MEMLSCPSQEAKPMSKQDIRRDWWQVSYVARAETKVKAYRWSGRATRKADDLYAKGIPCKIEPCRTDVYMAVQDGALLLIATRMNPVEASAFSCEAAKSERGAGILLWPHGSPLPDSLARKVIDHSEGRRVS